MASSAAPPAAPVSDRPAPREPVPHRRRARNLVAGGVLLLLAAAALAGRQGGSAAPQPSPAGAEAPADALAAAIERAEERLAGVPGDWRTWAQLGAVHVEQARVTADPSHYARAERALERSLAVRAEDNDVALTGLGALANARHDFAAAAHLAERALAINGYDATAWGVLTDARTQLGDYAGATEALDRMVALEPGVASFTRASYDAELRGDRAAARSALEQALERATTPADEAFCLTYLGALAWADGDTAGAAAHYDAAAAVLPGHPPVLLGQARVAVSRGEVDRATALYRQVVQAQPLPEHLVEHGEFLLGIGEDAAAAEQFALLGTVRQLFAANGVADDLDVALFEADHGDPATAVAAAEAEFARRRGVDVHDALGWALHRAGRHEEALVHARAATALGGRDARFLYHRGAIEAALGRTDEARASLSAALERNPHFSPLHAPRAERLLASLGGAR